MPNCVRRVGGGRERGAVGDVELQRQHFALTEFGDGRVEMILPDIGDHHLHPGLLQRDGDAEADARGAAGDEGCLPRRILHTPTPLRRGVPGFTGLPSPDCYL